MTDQKPPRPASDILRCGFCGVDLKTAKRRVFAGPSVYICEDCVILARDVFREDDEARARKPGERG